ncbi:MAG: DUF1003 domain-containing protein [Anaerolineales bacterium]|nr:DUF1003 domain-containing protein [Anaerolineales bacterium]MCB8961516.1 DUF1003 domain-containing protein [Ardenticatenales bacterium]
MKRLTFPHPFTHDHSPVQDVNRLLDERASQGERAADWVATAVGSWRFIIGQTLLLILWVILNVTALIKHWDPYPFILMNLFMSLQAAFTAPVIMMSQNRQAARDRLEAHNDFVINLKAEEEIRAVLDHLAAQDAALLTIHQQLAALTAGQSGAGTGPLPAEI